MPRLRCTLVLLVCLCTLVVPARRTHAQETTAATGAIPRRVAPGDTTLRAMRLRADTAVYLLTAFRDGSELSVGSITDVITRDGGDTPLLRRVLTVQRGASRLIDSTLSDARTLAPRQHRSQQPQRQLRIDFAGLKVRGTIGPLDGPGVSVDTTIASAVFDSGNWDLVVRAMPLAPGYAAVFRVYDIETGMHDYVVRVIGATPMMGETAHVVLFQLGGQREVTVWIGETTRHLLQVETPLGPTTVLRQTLRARATP